MKQARWLGRRQLLVSINERTEANRLNACQRKCGCQARKRHFIVFFLFLHKYWRKDVTRQFGEGACRESSLTLRVSVAESSLTLRASVATSRVRKLSSLWFRDSDDKKRQGKQEDLSAFLGKLGGHGACYEEKTGTSIKSRGGGSLRVVCRDGPVVAISYLNNLGYVRWASRHVSSWP